LGFRIAIYAPLAGARANGATPIRSGLLTGINPVAVAEPGTTLMSAISTALFMFDVGMASGTKHIGSIAAFSCSSHQAGSFSC
jgi:hypothetical protein